MSPAAMADVGSGVGAGMWLHRLSLLLMVASGFAGLGYQVAWTQQCALWLGHESAAVLAVLAAFFGGIALGALLLGERVERSARPGRWYAVCEAVIGLWALALLALMPPFSDALLMWMGPEPSPLRQWTLAFGGTFLLLLPATVAMGATLPAIERVMQTGVHHAPRRRSIAAFYASNTFGAVLGVIVTTFWLVPALGLRHTVLACALLNGLCALTAWLAWPGRAVHLSGHAAMAQGLALSAHATGARSIFARHRPLLLLAATGLLGIGYEVEVVRVLSQVAEDTVYTFAMLLAVYLVGTSLGAALYQRWVSRTVSATGTDPAHADDLSRRLLTTLAMASLLGACSLWGSEWLQGVLRGVLGDGMAAAVAAEACTAMAAFALPTLVMGALFSHLSVQAGAHGIGFGRALGVNTLGAALAPLLFGVVLTPLLGPKWVLMLLCGGYVALAMLAASSRPHAATEAKQATPAGASASGAGPSGSSSWLASPLWPGVIAVAVGLLAPPLAFVTIPEGGHVLSYRDGAMAAVSVVEDAEGVARLRINNRQQEGSSATLLVDGRQAMLPMLLHPAPLRALFLGVGTGVTSGTAAEDPNLTVDAVELLPEVIDATRHFWRVFDRDSAHERLRMVPADARRYVRATAQTYDLIMADNFQPARSGSGALYTVEHFKAVKARLAAGGLFCQWLPLHQLDLETLRSIVQSFMQAYPQGMAILANNSLETPVLGLVGRRDDGLFDPAQLQQRLAGQGMPHPPAAFGIPDPYALWGSVLAGPGSLKRFAADARANTDDLPVVAYMAPRVTYSPTDRPGDRLAKLLGILSVSPQEVMALKGDQPWARGLSAYWAARRRFIEVGLNVRPTGGVEAMLAQVQAPLLEVLRISPDFRPAYEPLVGMAMALAQSQPQEARALLTRLAALQPAWPEAHQALASLP